MVAGRRRPVDPCIYSSCMGTSSRGGLRSRTFALFAGAIVAVVIWFLGNLLVFPPLAAIRSGAGADLPGLTGCLMVSSVGLVVLDVWLKDRADDYLG